MPGKRKQQSESQYLDRRTLVVWVSLIVSLTLVSGLLLMLDPTPHAPAVGPVLTVLDATPQGLDGLLGTQDPMEEDRWKAIVVHHSGMGYGSAESLGREHQEAGYGGLAFHFVVGNGDGTTDGEIQAGYRWSRQLDAPGRGMDGVVSICIVGNGDEQEPSQAQMTQLVRLVRSLQIRLHVPGNRVFLERDLVETTSPGLLFPVTWFRQQLYDGGGLAALMP